MTTDQPGSFASLGLGKAILRGIEAAGYERPTEIQAQAIPLAREGHDLIGLGQTGSGKTAAFGLPILDRLAGGPPGLRALILVPTRELCVQVAENLRAYASHTELHVRTAFGGIPIGIQEAALRRGVDVLVACPGRLIDHMGCGNIDVSKVEVLVLDEADRMLDMGFMPQIRRVVSRLPQDRQNWLFSATMPPEIEKLVKESFGETKRVQVGQRSQAAVTILHRFERVSPTAKDRQLENLLRSQDGTVLVFVNKKRRAEDLGRKLQRAGLPADSIHGDKSAESRHVVLQAFSRGKTRIMVATDVAGRGIDVSDIGLVVNYDLPLQTEDYIHRVGRTGRAGREGEAVSYVTRAEEGQMNHVLRHLEKSSEGRARALVDGEMVLRPKTAKRDEDRDGAERGGRRGRGSERDSEHGERGGRGERSERRRSGGERDRDGRSRDDGRERPSRRRERGGAEPAAAGRSRRKTGRASQTEVALDLDVGSSGGGDDGFGAGL